MFSFSGRRTIIQSQNSIRCKETKQKQHTCVNKDFKEGLQSNKPFAAWGHVICFLPKLRETTIKIPDYGSKKHKPNSGQPILKIFKTGNRASLWWFE